MSHIYNIIQYDTSWSEWKLVESLLWVLHIIIVTFNQGLVESTKWTTFVHSLDRQILLKD